MLCFFLFFFFGVQNFKINTFFTTFLQQILYNMLLLVDKKYFNWWIQIRTSNNLPYKNFCENIVDMK